jgi:excisionase family DNA binding protein
VPGADSASEKTRAPRVLPSDRSATNVPQSCAAEGLYTVQELAAKLRLPISWVYERTRKNELPHGRYGKYIRFTDDDLRDIIAMGAANRRPPSREEHR